MPRFFLSSGRWRRWWWRWVTKVIATTGLWGYNFVQCLGGAGLHAQVEQGGTHNYDYSFHRIYILKFDIGVAVRVFARFVFVAQQHRDF